MSIAVASSCSWPLFSYTAGSASTSNVQPVCL